MNADFVPAHLATARSKIDADMGAVLVVIPTLNEAAHIAAVINGLRPFSERAASAGRKVTIVVVDGGSLDGTRDIVARLQASFDGLHLLNNPARLQSAAVNLAVSQFAKDAAWLIRIDAHARYPEDYCDILLDEAEATAADSVVVAMRAIGETPFQRAAALAQNTRIGNGGAAHRSAPAGARVEHGHHALMRLDAFCAMGGYDAGFSHNEDAELDRRLVASGRKIWLTGRTGLGYIPRRSVTALARQYFNFGRGRAQTQLKHRIWPRLRQTLPIAVLPAVLLALLAPLHPLFALPAVLWLSACLAGGLVLALQGHGWTGLPAGAIAALMHLAWSCGFWSGLATGSVAQVSRAAP
ncbi:glycosyltransferase family 2 protein [Thioclava sp.]|uniref:glycosyltransferase family 2 protein n=1 Tax=Thioclava sp. TaxID=1933450 RepID=UPI003AA93B72